MSATVHLRRAVAEDIVALTRFDPVAQARDAGRVDAIRTHVARGRVMVAVLESAVVGYVATTPGFLFGRDFVELLIVDSSHRRQGVGTALLREAVRRAASRRVFTSTNSSNRPMKGLLTSCAWVHSGTLDGLDPGDPEEFYYTDR